MRTKFFFFSFHKIYNKKDKIIILLHQIGHIPQTSKSQKLVVLILLKIKGVVRRKGVVRVIIDMVCDAKGATARKVWEPSVLNCYINRIYPELSR